MDVFAFIAEDRAFTLPRQTRDKHLASARWASSN